MTDESDANLFAIHITMSLTTITPSQTKALYAKHECSCREFENNARGILSGNAIDVIVTSQGNWINYNRSSRKGNDGQLELMERRIIRHICSGGRVDEEYLWAFGEKPKHRGRGRPRKEQTPVPAQSPKADTAESEQVGGNATASMYTGNVPTLAYG